MSPLEGLLVLDFSTLLPGPLASLMLAEAGAEVIKIERPGLGDEMRSYEPKVDGDSVNFRLLNRGKRSLAIDLKQPNVVATLRPLIERADILIEQFRPGVMARFGLGAEAVRTINPGIIYCSITGWGQSGPKSGVAAHDLNYMAETGLLGLTGGADGAPVLPPILAADIAGGTLPAVLNILLALRRRDATGEGATLDIAMGDSMLTFAYWGLGNGLFAGQWPTRGGDLVTGGSPRYNIYRTADDRFIAAAPLEERFWRAFCDAIELDAKWRSTTAEPTSATRAVADRIATRTADQWAALFAGHDVCCSIILDLQGALADPHFRGRGLVDANAWAGSILPSLPVPIDAAFRGRPNDLGPAPTLGEYQLD
ncbi:CaiB/BaiF CoA-transferase family protein [Sphingomonas sp.]|uniref:CaiB/BaiF CoA transferase family protein n=1 Tax=Sphingomonas sp. TaxID=28214 RepID=UPI00286B9E85|nr:CaiB/BaiF CoA-transferase family protein [Sphingomonas sp.]